MLFLQSFVYFEGQVDIVIIATISIAQRQRGSCVKYTEPKTAALPKIEQAIDGKYLIWGIVTYCDCTFNCFSQ